MEVQDVATTSENRERKSRAVNFEREKPDRGIPGGAIVLDDTVVAEIAGTVAREIEGIHEIGGWHLSPFGDDPKHGVSAEVGKKQAAFDLDVVLDFGSDIRDVCRRLRERIATEVDKMTQREVVEINVRVIGLHNPAERPKGDRPRVV